MKASMSSATKATMSSHNHLLGPSGFAKARSSCSSKKEANDIFIVENRPYIPTLLFDANDYEASVIHVAKVILSHHAAAGEIIDTSTMMTSTTTDKVTVISGGLTNALYRVDFISDNNEEGKSNNMTTTTTTCCTSVLVRIFGAEGMIDRDLETTNFSRLCDAQEVVLHSNLNYLGRFGNGRVETWLHDMRQGTLNDLHNNNNNMKDERGLVLEVMRQMARLHYAFDIPSYLLDDDEKTDTQQQQQQQKQPVLWSVLASWNDELITKISQVCTKDVRLANILYDALFGDNTLLQNNTASGGGPSQEEDDDENKEEEEYVVTTSELISHISQQFKEETRWLHDYIVEHHPNAPISFCHNDINAANILINLCLEDDNGGSCHDRNNVAIIDYEYGAINYAMYDVANFICEHCGGNDNGVPNYDMLPSMEVQRRLVEEYIGERNGILNTTTTNTSTIVDNDDEVTALLSQAQTFQMASHLYWGTWGILQGVTELLEGGTYEIENVKSRLHGESDIDRWDNLRYGHNRLARYREHKQSIISK
jgi:thiamine kinase-like enzyme